MCRCGTSGYGLVGTVVLGWWLDLMILEVSSNLNDPMILWFYDLWTSRHYTMERKITSILMGQRKYKECCLCLRELGRAWTYSTSFTMDWEHNFIHPTVQKGSLTSNLSFWRKWAISWLPYPRGMVWEHIHSFIIIICKKAESIRNHIRWSSCRYICPFLNGIHMRAWSVQ